MRKIGIGILMGLVLSAGVGVFTASKSDNDVLSAAITLRNPYVDVLSVLQISQLARKRKLTREKRENLEEVESILATTVSGIAQGLRNTG